MLRSIVKKVVPSPVRERMRTLGKTSARGFQWSMDACGFVVARKSDYYSPLPSRRQLSETRARWERPSALTGISYDLATMKTTLAELIDTYSAEFLDLLPYERARELGFGPGYPRMDALVLYSMLRAKKPKQYLEVGSGLSTYYADLAGQRNASEGRPMQITCVEPYPFAALKKIPGIRLIQSEVQDVEVGLFTSLGEDDVLFIDSSHIVRLDGDVPFLFLEVLPALGAGPLVHIHDIPFPYHCPYPADLWIYKQVWPMWWNESMLLHALLVGNKKFEVLLSTPLLRYHDETFLRTTMPGYRGTKEEENTFSSIWLKKH